MTREEILQAMHDRLSVDNPPEDTAMIMSCVIGQLDEWDGTWPYPQDDEFQALLSEQVYPILALYHAIHANPRPCSRVDTPVP